MSPSPPSDNSEPPKRASCDGCFLAKVRCGKEKPICTRCLATGLDCRYSPSARAGKRKAKLNKVIPSRTKAIMTTDICLSDDHMLHKMAYHPQLPLEVDVKEPHIFTLGEWPTPPGSDGGIHRSAIPTIPTPTSETNSLSETDLLSNPGQSTFDPSMTWAPTAQAFYTHLAPDGSFVPPVRSKSVADIATVSPWGDGAGGFLPTQDAHKFGPSTPNFYTPSFFSPAGTPTIPTCHCFASCLQALQSLHQQSASPQMIPFDVVLMVNRKAVGACAVMLSCQSCLSTSSINTSTMLLATIMTQIMSLYRAAAPSYFHMQQGTPNVRPGCAAPPVTQPPANGPVSPHAPFVTQPLLSLSYGTYRVPAEDGRWLEMEILTRELRKLKEVFSTFQETCAGRAAMPSPGGTTDEASLDEMGLHHVLANYLGQSLHFTLDMLNLQKDLVLG